MLQFKQTNNDNSRTDSNYSFSPFPSDPAARVKYAMATFSRFFSEHNMQIPTQEQPLRLHYPDYDKAMYMWTACVVFGQNIPNMQFGSYAVICGSKLHNDFLLYRKEVEPSFLWWGERFKSTSFYETTFKHHLTPDMLVISKTAALYNDIPGTFTIEEQHELKKKQLLQETKERRCVQATRPNVQDTAVLKPQTTDERPQGTTHVTSKIPYQPLFVAKTQSVAQKTIILRNNKALLMKASQTSTQERDIKQLLADGANINYQDEENGYTPLIIAVQHNATEVVKCLLLQGADPTLTTKDGKCVFDFVANEDVLALLMSTDAISSIEGKDSQQSRARSYR